MPDFLTHCLFAEDVLEVLPFSWKQRTAKNKRMLFLGAQGPDPFFYRGAGFWQNDRGYTRVANRLHTERTDAFLEALFTWTRDDATKDADSMLAYAVGFLSHYALDTQCHPYIFAFGGFAFNTQEKSGDVVYNHLMLEATVDAILFQRKKNRSVKKEKLWTWLPFDISEPIEQFYGMVLSSLYGFKDYQVGDVARALRDMKLAQKFLYDPYGVKEKIMGGLAHAREKHVYVGKPIYPTIHEPLAMDYLNESHQPWPDPVLRNTVYTDSFLDLYDQAMIRMQGYVRELELFFQGKREMQGLVEGFSYDTRLRWDAPENTWSVRGGGMMAGKL